MQEAQKCLNRFIHQLGIPCPAGCCFTREESQALGLTMLQLWQESCRRAPAAFALLNTLENNKFEVPSILCVTFLKPWLD